jgi:hypothetical protein
MVPVKTILLVILTLLSLALPGAAAPHQGSIAGALDPPLPDSAPPVVGHNGGIARNITVRGSYAYFSIGSELAVLDVSDPAHPLRVGQLTLPNAPMDAPAIDGNYAYVVSRNQLLVMDIAQPRALSIVASLPVEMYGANVVVVGHYLYLMGGGLLEIIDIRAPLAPIEAGRMLFSAYPMRVVGNYAYAGIVSDEDPGAGINLGPGLQVYDISNPIAPVALGIYRTTPPPQGIRYGVSSLAVEGSYAYITFAQCGGCPSQKAEILNVSNPAMPQRAGDLPAGPTNLTVANRYLYMAEKNILRIIDLSNPAAPAQIAAYPAGPKGLYYPPSIAVQGRYAYYAADDGLEIVDVSNPAAPNTVGSYTQIIYADGVAVAGRYAYVAAGYAGMAVLDIADPTNPTMLGRLAFSTWENVVAVSGHYAYLYSWDTAPPIGGNQRLLVVDVADPAAPKLAGSLALGGSTIIHGRDVAIAAIGSYVYLGSPTGLKIVDASDPAAPKVVGALPVSASDLVVDGRYLYLTYPTQGLAVVDIANPAKPKQVGMLPLAYAKRLALAGRYVYASDGLQLMIIDVANPTAPQLMSQIQLVRQLSDSSGEIAVDGRYVYVANKSVFQAIDVSNALAPTDAGAYLLVNGGQSDLYSSMIAASGGYAYVASGIGGLLVIRLGRMITGRMTHANGLPAPLAGVTLSAGAGLTATTDLSGAYTLDNVPSNPRTLTPSFAGYAFYPATRTITTQLDAHGQDFVALTGPVSAALAPGTPASLTSTDTQALPTQIDIPSGAVAANTTLVLTPTVATAPRGWAFAGHAFDLAAAQASTPIPNLAFGAPVNVSISYSAGDARLISDPDRLALWWWNGSAWQDAAETCSPAASYTRDLLTRTIGVAICRTGRFALFGPTRQVYLPLSTISAP